MKLLLLFLLFAPILYLAFRQKKWYLYLMVAFVGILPEQFSVRLHDSLPLLTGSRVLILIVAVFWLYERIKTRRLQVPISLLIFFGINIALALFHLFFDLDEIKYIAILLMERALVILMLKDMIDSRQEFERCIDFTILACCAIAVIGICQTVFDYDIASVLHLTETMASISLTPRMGLTRAYGTFNAISYGCYCAIMLLLIYYRLAKTNLQRYGVAFALTFTALICTFSRSSWVCIAAVFFVLLILGRKAFIKRMLPSAGMAILLCLVLCLPQPKLAKAYIETGKSVINMVLAVLPDTPPVPTDDTTAQESSGTDQSTSSNDLSGTVQDVPSDDDDSSSTPQGTVDSNAEKEPAFKLDKEFGLNGDDPSYSRVAQWTAVEYMTMQGKLITGYGYNAFVEGKLHYYFDRWDARWKTAPMLDVGLVAIITEGGLIGTGSLIGWLVFMAIYAWRRKGVRGTFDFYRVTLYMIPLYLMLNFTSAFPNEGILWLVWGLFYAYRKLDAEPFEVAQAACLDEKQTS